jgi:lysozyme
MDTAGKLTIGYGTNLHSLHVTEEEAEYLMRRRLDENEARLQRIPEFRALDKVRKDVLREAAYQLGVTGLAAFRRMWAAIGVGDFMRAAMEMLDSRVAKEQAPARWSVLARRMKTGKWHD